MDEFFSNFWPENDFRYYLQHHGVSGQKWGVRKAPWYPIEDYETHIKNTGKSSKEIKPTKLSSARTALKDGPRQYRNKIDYLNAISTDCLPFDDGPSRYMSKSEIEKRKNEAGKLGIKAFAKVDPDMIDESNDANNPDEYLLDWFVYGEQTIGLAMISDLINQGYTAKECSKLIDSVGDTYEDSGLTDRAQGMVFDIAWSEGNDYLKTFAKTCEQIKKN